MGRYCLRFWLHGRLNLNLYPFGARRSAGPFEKFREAWHLLNPDRKNFE